MCDKHVVKMILETAQILYTAWHCSETGLPEEEGAYRKTHVNHPMAKWIRVKPHHYEYAATYGIVLCLEYTRRYGRRHKTQDHLEKLKRWGAPKPVEESFDEKTLATQDLPDGIEFIPLCMPDEFRGKRGIAAYRAYYKSKKKTIDMRWTKCSPPSWFRIEKRKREE